MIFPHVAIVLPFLGLGVTPGVQLRFLPEEDEAVSEAIIPTGSVPLAGTDHSTFYVRKCIVSVTFAWLCSCA